MASGIRRARIPWWPGLVLALVLASASAAAFASVSGAPSGAAVGPPPGAAAAQNPLGLVTVELEQRDVRMLLRITTTAAWTAGDLAAVPGRSVCITFAQGEPPAVRGRLCVTRRAGSPALSYTALAADGTELETRPVGGDVTRPRAGVFEATFLPVAASLTVGPYAWWAQTAWTDAAGCARTCGDRFPDGAGVVAGQLGLLGAPPCFGAAARQAGRTCDNPDLRLTVDPPLQRANVIIDSHCDERLTEPLSLCAFGAAPQDAAGTFALIGDSHAAGLKSALAVVTLGKRWRGISIVRSACPATQASRPILPTRERSRQCVEWNRKALAWLAEHPEVDTAFLSSHTTAEVKAASGETMAQTAQAGYRDEIRALLRTVKRVVVIRDTPSEAPGHLGCVMRALEASRAPGTACARPRRDAIEHDPLAAAARAMRSSRVRLIDLTRHVCNERRCFPVVGGALVHRNRTHLTPTFSATLGPYILQALDR